MSGRWFRYYDDALDDPKVQRLAPHLFRAWVNMLCLASKGGGKLPAVSDIGFKLRLSEIDAQGAVDELILAGLIDIAPNGSLSPHNWNSRQYSSDNSADRTRKWRENKDKKYGDVTVTACDEKCDAIESYTDTEKNPNGPLSFSTAARSRAKDQGIILDFGKRQDDKKEKIVRRAEGLGIPTDALLAKVNAHKAKNRPAYFTKLCVEWLMPKLPGIDEQILRDALWGKNDQYGVVVKLLMAVTP